MCSRFMCAFVKQEQHNNGDVSAGVPVENASFPRHPYAIYTLAIYIYIHKKRRTKQYGKRASVTAYEFPIPRNMRGLQKKE